MRCVLVLRTLHHDSQALLLQLPLLLCRPHVEIRVLRRGTSLAQTYENAPVVQSMLLDCNVCQPIAENHDSQSILLQLPLLLCRPHVEIRVLRRGTSLAQTHENAPVVWSMPLDYHVCQRNIENGFGENSSFNITTTLSLSLYVPHCGDSLHKI